MPIAYRNQITKTFRDNAIRSVLLIDDDYSPYPELASHQKHLLDKLYEISNRYLEVSESDNNTQNNDNIRKMVADFNNLKNLTKNSFDSFKRTHVAEQFVKFFHGEQCICDVEKQTQNLNPEKVRKSDLIILDYCLSGTDATKSLELLRELSTNKHLNLVVVYTNQPLNNVWLEIASTLRSSKSINTADFFDEQSLAIWDDADDVFQDNWTPLSRDHQIRYILGHEEEIIHVVKELFWSDIQNSDDFDANLHKEPTDQILRYFCELDIRKNNKLPNDFKNAQIHGSDELWIQSGEVFITLCEKKGETAEEIAQEPRTVWDKLSAALHDWYPSFYRVALSELQNRIEDSNFAMSKALNKAQHEQIALLWSILKENPDNQLNISEGMLSHLLQDISKELLRRDDNAASKFLKDVANSVSENIPDYIAWKKSDPEPHNKFIKTIIQIAKTNFRESLEPFDLEYCQNIAHAFNELISTQDELPRHITTGTILVSDNKKDWFVCVTPSCDTVPEQMANDHVRAMSPHRQLTFIKLIKEDTLSNGLKVAAQSSHIFVKDLEGKRIALRAINEFTKQPYLVELIVEDHASPLTNQGKNVTAITTVQKKKNKGTLIFKKCTLFPVAQLKPDYAARLQAIQSHHLGRIGVDYATVDLSLPEQE
ncbi:response regulator receiver domain [Hydrogenovibrio sp. JE_KL2]|uniref:response regulator receiver domain n=1 Tax=Hydrogenovibrio sp. JE_KL2 TaxID=2651188 RepID=UPI00128BA563|nr:response regulator receiver domain [Hydrogenovibrio sp. JE_KL2]MPQ76834.1 hypothetical protein [Hydrogenovibrio sp. JE_KL2]